MSNNDNAFDLGWSGWMAGASMSAAVSNAVGGSWGWAAAWLAASALWFVVLHRAYRRARTDEIAALLGGPLLAQMSQHPGAVITISRAEHDDGPQWRMTVTHARDERGGRR